MSTNKAALLWEQVLTQIEKEIPGRTFETWIKPLVPLNMDEKSFELGASKNFVKEWIEDHFSGKISAILNEVAGQSFVLAITNMEDGKNDDIPEKNLEKSNEFLSLREEQSIIKSALPLNKDDISASINKKYTFDNFVIGNSNRFACAASRAVAEAPARAYNPLFLYGGVGLGKTHLMYAIGNEIKANNPALNVLYISSELFTNELINSIRDKNTEKFRQKYRNIDCLMVDDIQFIANKEHTQEEFFHTFNTLHNSNKQIIISSDRPPKEITTLEERLRSRFEQGLITDIQPPDIETRIAILQKKAIMQNLEIPSDVITFVASKIQNNIRELEGALLRIVAFSSVNKLPINMDAATESLKNIIDTDSGKPVTIEKIQDTICSHYKIKKEELLAKKRTRNIVYPRQIAMYLCRELTDSSLPRIGEMFGGRDHTTVIHAIEKIHKEIEIGGELSKEIQSFIKKINS